MTDAKDVVLEYLRHIGAGLDPDFLREAIKVMSALFMERERKLEATYPFIWLDALYAPSGVDTTTGTVFDQTIKVTATMTLTLPKAGLCAPGVESQVGEPYLTDISVPQSLYAEPALALEVKPLFAESEILRLR